MTASEAAVVLAVALKVAVDNELPNLSEALRLGIEALRTGKKEEKDG